MDEAPVYKSLQPTMGWPYHVQPNESEVNRVVVSVNRLECMRALNTDMLYIDQPVRLQSNPHGDNTSALRMWKNRALQGVDVMWVQGVHRQN